jgi:hypothetical protein
MFIFLTIFLFIITAIAMLILRLVRPRLSIQGFLAVVALISGLVLVWIARSDIPTSSSILNWAPDTLFPVSPSLTIDGISWSLSLTMAALAITLTLSSISQVGLSRRGDTTQVENNHPTGEQEATLTIGSPLEPRKAGATIQMPNWLFWIVVLVATSLGLVAVNSGNLLTLIMAWVALDIVELAILIGHSLESEKRERAAITFSAKMAGIVLLLVGGLINWTQSGSFDYSIASSSVTVILVLAAAIRLGVLPPFTTFTHQLRSRQDIATLTFLVPASASYILLIRIASAGTAGAITPYLIALAAVVGVVSGIQWLSSADVEGGKRYWMVGCASMVVICALLGQVGAAIAWSVAGLLSGGLVFSFSIRNRNLIPILVLGIFNLSALPFSPTWQTTFLYQNLVGFSPSLVLNTLFLVLFLCIQATLLAGFTRHLLRGIIPPSDGKSAHIERWVWTVFPIGLLVASGIHFILGIYSLPELSNLSLSSWIIGPIVLLVSALLSYLNYRASGRENVLFQAGKSPFWKKISSNEWIYNLVWKLYRWVSRVSLLISTILEGEGGILWALVLFALIFVFLQR